MRFLSLCLGASLLVGAQNAQAEKGTWRIGGYTGVEARIFTQDKKWDGQVNNPDLSFIITPEFRYRSADRKQRINFIPYLRGSTVDSERSHGDIREAYWSKRGEEFDILVGIDQEFWGVTESVHLVNIINQVDLVEDPDQEDYLGQPMIRVSSQRDWGLVEGYLLPYFRERTFPGEEGRLRTRLAVDTDNAIYEHDADELYPSAALRYAHVIDEFDIGLSYFHGIGREPTFVATNEGRLRPRYEIIDQVGLDLQYTTESWLWKLEAIGRAGQGDSFAAAVGGFEYSFYQIFETDMDLGLLLEYQWDDRNQNEAPPTAADNDIFSGARLAFNDVQDSEILAGFSFDHENQDTFISIEAETRIGEDYFIEARGRFIVGADEGEDLYDFARDDYIQIRFARYF